MRRCGSGAKERNSGLEASLQRNKGQPMRVADLRERNSGLVATVQRQSATICWQLKKVADAYYLQAGNLITPSRRTIGGRCGLAPKRPVNMAPT